MNNTSNKTQCVWSDLSTLLFPGLLKEETDHTLITPILPNYTPIYLRAENALSELDTKELKELARQNLEISNKVEWGNIEGELSNQKDLKKYLEDIIPINAVTIENDQTITGLKQFNNGVSINGKTLISNDIDSGELTAFPQGTNLDNKGFIIRSTNRTDTIPTVEIIATNKSSSYNYNFPKKSGTVAFISDLTSKQDIISDLETIRQGAAKGATSIQNISHLATKEQINSINLVSWSILEDLFNDYVDLGLPSGTLWATCNVGATSPEEYGDYFAWSETYPKSSYSSSTSVTANFSASELKSRGIIDADGNLTAEYDAATVNLGDKWRMPTLDEINELVNNCTWIWTAQNGVNGSKVTGPNGNSIFLPATGFYQNTSLGNTGSIGFYWSATHSSGSYDAYYIQLKLNIHYYYSGARIYGFTVRPVINLNN